MFGNKNLNKTIAKVQGFIKDLEIGVAENEKAIKVNETKVDNISKQESTDIGNVVAKAAAARVAVVNQILPLQEQNKVAKKLLNKLQ